MTTVLDRNSVTEYDFIIGLDASGSMLSASTRYPGKTRWQELQETAFGLAHELGQFDADGIDLVVFGGGVELFEGVTADKISDIFTNRSPKGGTPLAEALSKIVAKQKASGKKTVAIIFTDGEPDNRAAAEQVIVDASNALEKDEDLTFLFLQVGNDSSAAAYLDHLDDGLTGKAKFDIVDAIPASVADTMSTIDMINKAIND